MGNKITILRFEHPDSLGMYGVQDGKEMSAAYEVFGVDAPNHRAPADDKKLCKAAAKAEANLSDYFYAFSSIAQARRWCYRNDWLVGLHERGVVLSEYVCEISETLVGNFQVCFKSSDSRESFSILSLPHYSWKRKSPHE